MELLARAWQASLGDLLAGTRRSLLLAAPYIKEQAAEWVVGKLAESERRDAIRTTIMTDVSPDSVLSASLDIRALLLFTDSLQRVTITDVRRLHAKVYLADDREAIITSGNLTSSAFAANREYGIAVTDGEMVKQISDHMDEYERAGRRLSRAELARLEEAGRDFRGQYDRESGQREAGARNELAREWNRVSEEFGAPRGIHEKGSARFKGPIVEVLATRGPLATNDLCQNIQASWPYLCDDGLIRVAKDGTRKRQWRHDIHTAQETLQRQGVVHRDANGRWHVERRGSP